MAEKKSSQERLREITAGIEQGIQELFDSEKYKTYLQTMGRFHHYSLNNILLIHAQRPNATRVAGFNKWRDQFGRHVKMGEKGIQILAPIIYKKKVEEVKLDPDTKVPVLDENGKVVLEEKEVKVPRFKVVYVYDVAQTEGKPLPELASDLHGNVEQYDIFMEALRRSSPVPMELKPLDQNTDGFFSLTDQRITIRDDMSQVQTIAAVVHEITHALLHNYEQSAENAKDHHTEEVEAESVAYSVCQYYGIETSENSFGYIAGWSQGKELKELRASLEIIQKTASSLISDIDRHFADICKERGVDLNASTQEAAVEVPELSMPDNSITVEAMQEYGYVSGDMLPLSKDRARELFEGDCTVFMLYDGNTEAMVFDPEDIEMHSGIFGVSREDWAEVSNKFPPAPEQAEGNAYEKAFLEGRGDSYAIYQLRATEDNRRIMFESADWMERYGFPIEYGNYAAVYAGDLPKYGSREEKLEQLFETFNVNHPAGFTGHSLSVSDVVAIREGGTVSCHYVDTIGFKELPAFLPENYLKTAEMTVEDDYGMIDAIINNGPKEPTVADLEAQVKVGQTISLMDLANAVKREGQPQKGQQKGTKTPSVLAKLKYYKELNQSADATHKNAEREL